MLRIFLSATMLFSAFCIYAQTYPDPEFTNELYYYNKAGGSSLVRLEKTTSKMNTKTSAISGSENSYDIEGSKSPVRVNRGGNLSFVISDGSSSSSSGSSSSTPQSDSAMRANGIDPSMMKEFTASMSDPGHTITLYKLDLEKGQRKVLLQKTPGMNPFGSHKMQSSDKYTFSVRKVKSGYWELVVDKTLPRGEYAFTMLGGAMGAGSMDGSSLLFAFGVD